MCFLTLNKNSERKQVDRCQEMSHHCVTLTWCEGKQKQACYAPVWEVLSAESLFVLSLDLLPSHYVLYQGYQNALESQCSRYSQRQRDQTVWLIFWIRIASSSAPPQHTAQAPIPMWSSQPMGFPQMSGWKYDLHRYSWWLGLPRWDHL